MTHPGLHRPARRAGHRPWQGPAAERLAAAPPQWATAAPPRAVRPRHAYRTALLVAATCGIAAIARAQVATGGGDTGTGGTAAPPAGGTGGTAAPDAAPGSLRAAIESVLPGTNQPVAGATTTPAWTVIPAISLQEEWTDNAFLSNNRRSSLITVVQPSLAIIGSTSRLTADLYYSPSISLYVPEGSQNQYGQNLAADALLTLVPDEFYIKTTGFAGVQSAVGAIAPNGVAAQPKSNQVQTYNFSIEPYLTHRFGGWGTGQLGLNATENTAGAVAGGNAGAYQNLTSEQVFGIFKSGENFGRLSSTLTASATRDTGSGALQGASQTVANYQAGYAITREIIALGSIGWEDIIYTGPGAPHYNDATWSAGVQLLPNPDSSIIATYGHQNGATDASVNANYAPTASIRLSAQYSSGVTTAAQALNSVLADATFDPLGRPVDAITGATLLPTNNFFGFNGGVYKSTTLSLTAAWLLPRDSFQLTVQKQTQTPIGANGQVLLAVARDTTLGTITESAGLAASSGTTGTLSWQHDLSKAVNTTLSFQYGVLNNATPLTLTNGVLTATGKQVQNARLVAFTAGVNWQLNETLTSTLQYSYTSNDYSGGVPGVSANLVVLGLRKTF